MQRPRKRPVVSVTCSLECTLVHAICIQLHDHHYCISEGGALNGSMTSHSQLMHYVDHQSQACGIPPFASVFGPIPCRHLHQQLQGSGSSSRQFYPSSALHQAGSPHVCAPGRHPSPWCLTEGMHAFKTLHHHACIHTVVDIKRMQLLGWRFA